MSVWGSGSPASVSSPPSPPSSTSTTGYQEEVTLHWQQKVTCIRIIYCSWLGWGCRSESPRYTFTFINLSLSRSLPPSLSFPLSLYLLSYYLSVLSFFSPSLPFIPPKEKNFLFYLCFVYLSSWISLLISLCLSLFHFMPLSLSLALFIYLSFYFCPSLSFFSLCSLSSLLLNLA